MKIPVIAVAGVAAAAVVVGTSAVGCSKNTSTSTKSSSSTTSASSTTKASSSTTAQAGDYSGLLIKETDIAVPGDTFTAMPPAPVPNGQPGVVGQFNNQAGTRVIGDTIVVFPDASGATTALEGAKGALASTVTGTPGPAAVGTGGTMVSGNSPDGSKAVTVLLFNEGKAFTTIEFDSAPNDPVPPEIVTDIGQKQDAAITAGLPG
jgi:hypothetical protein